MAEDTVVHEPDVKVRENQVHTEVLDMDGKNIKSDAGTNLGAIFDKIESGQKADEAIKEVMEKPKRTKKEPVKLEEKKDEVKTEEPSDLEKKLKKPEPKANETPTEVTRESLRKSGAPKEEAKPEDKSDDPDLAEDLKVLETDKPKTVKRIQTLLRQKAEALEMVENTKKQAAEKDAAIKDLQSKLSNVKAVDPEVQKQIDAQLEELSMHRRRYQLENDPEVKTKFGDRITKAEQAVPEILKRNNAGDAMLKLISDAGGWSSFAQSGRPVTLSDGSQITSAEFAEKVRGALNPVDRAALDAALIDKETAKREKDRFFEEEGKKANDYFKKRDEEARKATEAYQKQIEDGRKQIEKWQEDALKEDFLKEKPVPADATDEVKKAIDEDNRYTKQLQSLLKQSINVKDVAEALEMAKDSVRYYDERRKTAKLSAQVQKLERQLQDKQAEIDNFKKGSRTTRSGSISSPASAPENEKKKEYKTLGERLDAIARGELVE